MKTKYLIIALVTVCIINLACLKSESASSKKETETSKSPIETKTNQTPIVQKSEPTTNEKKNENPVSEVKPLKLEDLQTLITNNIGSLLIINSYKPSTLNGDFNGDGFADTAAVVGAQDKYGNEGEIGHLFDILGNLSVGVSFQNLQKGGVLLAHPKQDASGIEKNKSKLQAQSKLGLLIIFGSKDGLEKEITAENYDKKFLLLDSLFEANFEDAKNAPDMLGVIKKGDKCLPKECKGEGILSGDAESAAKAIYFNGKTFAWTQCGD